MRKKRPSWGAYERNWARFILTYRLGVQGKASRQVMYKRALFTMGRVVARPFRKE